MSPNTHAMRRQPRKKTFLLYLPLSLPLSLRLPLLVAFSLSVTFTVAQSRPAIIFDTDMGPDYDDVGALAMLHNLANKGECRILATIASDNHPRVAAVLSVLNTYYKRPTLPIGVVRGEAVNIPAWQKWDSLLLERYPHEVSSNEQAEEAVSLCRRILLEQPDHSVTIVTVGFLTNLANLLKSEPDRYSSLSGLELVRKKVKKLVSMAACFNAEMGTFREFNVKMDAKSSVYAFENWPTPIIFSGFEIGAAIHTGLPITQKNELINSPVKDVFSLCIPMDPNDKNGRMSWDETAVLVAVRGHRDYFDLVEGKYLAKADGSNDWNFRGKGHFFLKARKTPAEIAAVIDQLIIGQ